MFHLTNFAIYFRKFKLNNYNKDERKDITNVFGIIKGSEEPGELLILIIITNNTRFK